MAGAIFEAGPRYPERARFDGLSNRVASAFIRALSRDDVDLRQLSDADIAALTDAELLTFWSIGPKTLAEIRSRFPYRPKEAGDHGT